MFPKRLEIVSKMHCTFRRRQFLIHIESVFKRNVFIENASSIRFQNDSNSETYNSVM